MQTASRTKKDGTPGGFTALGVPSFFWLFLYLIIFLFLLSTAFAVFCDDLA